MTPEEPNPEELWGDEAEEFTKKCMQMLEHFPTYLVVQCLMQSGLLDKLKLLTKKRTKDPEQRRERSQLKKYLTGFLSMYLEWRKTFSSEFSESMETQRALLSKDEFARDIVRGIELDAGEPELPDGPDEDPVLRYIASLLAEDEKPAELGELAAEMENGVQERIERAG